MPSFKTAKVVATTACKTDVVAGLPNARSRIEQNSNTATVNNGELPIRTIGLKTSTTNGGEEQRTVIDAD